MSETPEVTFDPPAKKKKATKKAKPRAAAPKDNRPSAPFPGLTRSKCSDECYARGECSISGSYCAHPTKGGLQGSDMNNPKMLKRLNDARDQIDIRLDPDRFK